ncbi:hypothetical protein S40293_10265 [Stachybotrys chartarum IBT 40293]|nr:hypothetical protein S40293_10265 [Stachybotrys chartarum IBT 40293]
MAPELTVKGLGHGGRCNKAIKAARYLMKLQISKSRREQDVDNTCRPDVEPEDNVGDKFEPFDVPDCDFLIRDLPATPLKLFQEFLPILIVEKWVRYTNEAPGPVPEDGSRYSRQNRWKPTSVEEVYIWIGILIYMTLHKEFYYEDHWKAITRDSYVPSHPIIQFMPFDRFFLLKRRLRTYNPTYIKVGIPDPFNQVNEWSNYMMEASVRLVEISSIVGVNEGIIGFKGQSRHKITIKIKPTPTGLKVWILAAQGYLLRWYWHQPGPKYGPVGIEADLQALAKPSNNNQSDNEPSDNEPSDNEPSDNELSDTSSDASSDNISYDSSSEDSADEGPDEGLVDLGPLDKPSHGTAEELLRGVLTKLPALNPTQAVVVALVSQLPPDTYHIFLDNLFLSPDLFRALRILGAGATGTCRTNCGLYRDIVIAKEDDRKGKGLWP